MSAPRPAKSVSMPMRAPETSWNCDVAEDEEPVGVAAAEEPADEAPPEAEPAALPMLEAIDEAIELPPAIEEPPDAEPVGLAEAEAGDDLEEEPPAFGYLAAQEQTATAADEAWMPVTAPQAETTQLSARELMAEADFSSH